MQFEFTKAVKERAKLRLAFISPAGGGKTYSALKVATELLKKLLGRPGRIAGIDTEHESMAKYADLFDFHSLCLKDFSPIVYTHAIKAAERAGFEAIVIDSLSHAWAGPGGVLEMVDEIKSKTKSGASHHGWREMTPHHHALVEAMLQSPCHIFATAVEGDSHRRGRAGHKIASSRPRRRHGVRVDVVADMEDLARSTG